MRKIIKGKKNLVCYNWLKATGTPFKLDKKTLTNIWPPPPHIFWSDTVTRVEVPDVGTVKTFTSVSVQTTLKLNCSAGAEFEGETEVKEK